MTQNWPGDNNDTNDTNVLNDTNDTNVLNDTNDTNVLNDTKCYGAAESRERGTLSFACRTFQGICAPCKDSDRL